MKYNLDKIRALNPLSVELARYGIAPDRKGFARCPFHNEKTASFRVYPDDTFHCFGCGAHGDVITFVMKMQNIDFNAACSQLDGEISYSEQRKINKIKREREKAAEKRNTVTDEYFFALDMFEANEAIIKQFKPASQTEQPRGVWFVALNMRSVLQYNLELAEARYMREGD
jgi:DNA primase